MAGDEAALQRPALPHWPIPTHPPGPRPLPGQRAPTQDPPRPPPVVEVLRQARHVALEEADVHVH